MSDSDFLIKTKYECKYCHKLFNTTKHDCKWNPNKRNCLTCKHCIGFEQGEGDIYDSSTLGFIEHQSSYFLCEKDLHDFAELEAIHEDNWNGYCEDYEQSDCDNFRKRYAEIIAEQRERELNDRKFDALKGIKF